MVVSEPLSGSERRGEERSRRWSGSVLPRRGRRTDRRTNAGGSRSAERDTEVLSYCILVRGIVKTTAKGDEGRVKVGERDVTCLGVDSLWGWYNRVRKGTFDREVGVVHVSTGDWTTSRLIRTESERRPTTPSSTPGTRLSPKDGWEGSPEQNRGLSGRRDVRRSIRDTFLSTHPPHGCRPPSPVRVFFLVCLRTPTRCSVQTFRPSTLDTSVCRCVCVRFPGTGMVYRRRLLRGGRDRGWTQSLSKGSVVAVVIVTLESRTGSGPPSSRSGFRRGRRPSAPPLSPPSLSSPPLPPPCRPPSLLPFYDFRTSHVSEERTQRVPLAYMVFTYSPTLSLLHFPLLLTSLYLLSTSFCLYLSTPSVPSLSTSLRLSLPPSLHFRDSTSLPRPSPLLYLHLCLPTTPSSLPPDSEG